MRACLIAWRALDALNRHLPAHANGLYRIRAADASDTLLYVGQGRIRIRLDAHQRKAGNPVERQAEVFAGPLECSWVLNEGWYPYQRLELENDLIAAYVLTMGTVPVGQFLG